MAQKNNLSKFDDQVLKSQDLIINIFINSCSFVYIIYVQFDKYNKTNRNILNL